MDAKKQNRIIIGTMVILLAMVWIGYLIFTVALGRQHMWAESAFCMASMMIIAMGFLTMVNPKQAVAYTEQIPMEPVKAPWEEEGYLRLKTHAARAMWLIYRITGNKHADLFYQWVTDNLEWRLGCEESKSRAYSEFLNFVGPSGDVDNYLFDVSNENWWNHDDIGNGQIKCFVLNFWERQSDGSKKWIRVFITDKIAELYLQPGVSDGRSESMDPTEKPRPVDMEILKTYLGGFSVQ